jgi:hypothetical protein
MAVKEAAPSGADTPHQTTCASSMGVSVPGYQRRTGGLSCGMKQIKVVKPKPSPRRDVEVDTRTPSGRRRLPY